ncbi:hypothetical protein [Novosphingobium sp. RL4]|uniref:hypothetical protein n=1 Tax=Novosphingobium sp. RL4 TaxID=3109595 RepID=UPI002D79C9EB|nr:hypothetical protein [Novosphingobium sp. RL4]WRT95157.1 hypothetical protein U9J33_23500 [Novosphingobium sp. RL4]
MASDQHRKLTMLVRELAREGKYLTIEIHEERPAGFAEGTVLKSLAARDASCCRRWGYDPATGQRICIEPC